MNNPPVRYLLSRLGDSLKARRAIAEATGVLRHCSNAPRAPLKPVTSTHDAMVAKVVDRAGGFLGIHVTLLRPDGSGKLFGDKSRYVLGKQPGGAIRLAPMQDGVLAIAEGIETSLAFHIQHGVPTWAARNAGGIQQFQPPEGLKRLIIAADSDDQGEGLRAAEALYERLRGRVRVQIAPAPAGMDWADVLNTDVWSAA